MERIFPDGVEAVRERAPGPIHVETDSSTRVVEPVAYTCLRFMLVREGRLFVHSRHGTAHARPGMLVIVCAGTLCGAIPEPSATVTTAFVNLDYLLDQLTWRLNGLLRDRHEAELIAAKAFRHNMWATTPPAAATADMLDLLDRTEAIQNAGGGFYNIESVFAGFLAELVPLMPYRELPGEPVVSLAGDGVGGRFPPLRPEIVAVGDAIQADLSRRWSLEDMAQVAHISGRHLARVFNESYGLPPVQFLAALRAKEMARLLREKPGWSVEAVGRQVGWEGRSHARHQFVRELGLSPDEYRRRAHGLDLATPGPETDEYTPGPS
ncbi:helix-turn-helix transcriptional regulator [Brevibacterium casei]|uniref:helix-turn-helix domain-containing protein n=1 Tax=Brevibacterium casei TaxID=33889 RepID=UPI00191A9B78|nr:AraC family transcriptional regulator [Brevibacterium casei]QQT70808.1 helix-turn-helix transcriptional regulator [Brevibacterium casei]